MKFLVTTGVMLTSSGGVSCVLNGCEGKREVPFEKVYDFLEHLEEGTIITPTEDFVRKIALSIGGEERDVMFEHPPSAITFNSVPVGRSPRMRFGAGIGDGAWEGGCDGVTFEIIVTDKGRSQSIYSRFIDPKNTPEDRRWFDEDIALTRYEGKEVSITFKTSAGLQGDNTSDWAGWSAPRLHSLTTKRIAKAQHPNVILVTLDTTRADHLACYGYSRETTPFLDRLARKGLLFLNALSPSPWTIPAHASLFTGLFPTQHGAITRVYKDVVSGYPLPQDDTVLARVLQTHGYRTAGFVGGPFMKTEFGFSHGFDTYDDMWEGYDRRADKINENAIRWLDGNYRDPFFLFVNYFDPHAPYDPPGTFASPFKRAYTGNVDFTTFGPHKIKLGEAPPLNEADVKHAVDLYDTEILYTDHYLGRLVQRLEALGLLDNALLIITADHGESFGERGIWGHGALPIESQVRVPLIVHCPSRLSRSHQVRDQVQITSLYSTILRFLGIPVSSKTAVPWYDIDLLAVGEGDNKGMPAFTFAERYSANGYFGMIRSNEWKYLYSRIKGEQGEEVQEWIFDLKGDPAELQNLIGRDKGQDGKARRRFSQLRELLARFNLQQGTSASSRQEPMDENMREKLKALGYVR